MTVLIALVIGFALGGWLWPVVAWLWADWREKRTAEDDQKRKRQCQDR